MSKKNSFTNRVTFRYTYLAMNQYRGSILGCVEKEYLHASGCPYGDEKTKWGCSSLKHGIHVLWISSFRHPPCCWNHPCAQEPLWIFSLSEVTCAIIFHMLDMSFINWVSKTMQLGSLLMLSLIWAIEIPCSPKKEKTNPAQQVKVSVEASQETDLQSPLQLLLTWQYIKPKIPNTNPSRTSAVACSKANTYSHKTFFSWSWLSAHTM